MSDLPIRPARPDDHPGVAAVCATLGRPVWPESAFEDHPDRLALVATHEGRVVGFAKTHHHPEPDAPAPAGHYLGGVVVAEQWRRRGLGFRLTAARLDWIAGQSTEAFYFTNENNAASIALHAPFGFRLVTALPTIRGVSADDGKAMIRLYRSALAAPRSRPEMMAP